LLVFASIINGERGDVDPNRPECHKKKKIIVDVNGSGFGNRLLGIVSTAILAVHMDRALFLRWDNTEHCGAEFQDLFQVDPSMTRHDAFFPVNDSSKNILPSREIECSIKLTQYKKFLHFWFLRDIKLLKRLHEQCDVILIATNQYYAPILFSLGKRGHYLRHMFQNLPFKSLSQCLFRIREDIKHQADISIKKLNEEGKWLSIHVRGYYEKGFGGYKKVHDASDAFICAKKLLDKGIINNVFFATESAEMDQMIRKYVPFEKIIRTKKSLIGSKELEREGGFEIRKEMQQAVIDWYILGQADYCMSPTFSRSTYSETALLAGNCKVIALALIPLLTQSFTILKLFILTLP